MSAVQKSSPHQVRNLLAGSPCIDEFLQGTFVHQVKQMDKVGRPDVDKFEAAMMRTKRRKGFSVGFDFSSDALSEIGQFFKREHVAIVPLTVREIPDETIAQRLV